jgi:hypothetical protein
MTTELVVTLICAIFASTGFWAFVTTLYNKHGNKVSNETKLLKGIAHDRICYLGEHYIKQGFLTRDDYENLYEYLYVPYHELGGNGSAERIMMDVQKLPLRKG